MKPEINVKVDGSQKDITSTYVTKILRGGNFAAQVKDVNTKYIIKWDFDLKGQTITMPTNILLEFDGGSISNGTLIGNQTVLIYFQDKEDILKDVVLEGTWKNIALYQVQELQEQIDEHSSDIEILQNETSQIDGIKEDIREHSVEFDYINDKIDTLIERSGGGGDDVSPSRRAPDYSEFRGMKKISLYPSETPTSASRRAAGETTEIAYQAVLTRENFTESNAIYVIQFDFTLGEDITIPENCVLEFDGGSLSGGNLNLNHCNIVSSNYNIFKNVKLSQFNHTFLVDWCSGSNDYESITASYNALTNGGELLFQNRTYNVNQKIIFDKLSYFSIRGTNKTPIFFNDKSNCGIEITSSMYDSNGCFYQIKDIRLIGNENTHTQIDVDNYSFGDGIGLNILKGRCDLSNIEVSRFYKGINFCSAINSHIKDCFFHDCGIGFSIDTTLGVFNSNTIETCSFRENVYAGISIYNNVYEVSQNTIKNCLIESNGVYYPAGTSEQTIIEKETLYRKVYGSGIELKGNGIANLYVENLYMEANIIAIYVHLSTLMTRVSFSNLKMAGGNIKWINDIVFNCNGIVNDVVFNFITDWSASNRPTFLCENNENLIVNDSLVNIRREDFSKIRTTTVQYNKYNYNDSLKTRIIRTDEIQGGVIYKNEISIEFTSNTYYNGNLTNKKVYNSGTEIGYISACSGNIATATITSVSPIPILNPQNVTIEDYGTYVINKITYSPSFVSSNIFKYDGGNILTIGESIYNHIIIDGNQLTGGINRINLNQNIGGRIFALECKNANIIINSSSFIKLKGNKSFLAMTPGSVALFESGVSGVFYEVSATLNLKSYGQSIDRPIQAYVGIQYFDQTLNKLIVNAGGKWYEGDSAIAGVLRSGTFAQKPNATDIYVGFKYFCTDKQTTEGATDGIEIIHKGNNVWVDALGRVVS